MIPCIDMPGPLADWTVQERTTVAEAIGKAFRNGGFYQASNHGVPTNLISETFAEMMDFYRLPQLEKARYAASEGVQFLGYRGLGGEKSRTHSGTEACEQYRIGNITDELPLTESLTFYHERFSTAMALFGYLTDLGDTILSACALDLGLPKDFFNQFLTKPMHRLGLNYYGVTHRDEVHNEVDYAMSPHTDLSLITILTQDELGLEVRTKQGEWIQVPVVPDTLFVFLGDYVHRWANGTYDATPHRVCEVQKDRRSIQYKHRPNYNTIIAPLEHFTGPGNPGRYEAIDTGPNYVAVLKSILRL